MIRLSASAVPRLLACPGSGFLPHADYRTDYADAGHERHADQESAADLGDHDGLDPRVAALLQPGDQLATECSFAYDASDDTARALGHLARRDYQELRPFEIPGTIDLLVRGSGRVLVVDYKGIEDVDAAAENLQIATYALMVARDCQLEQIDVAVVYLAAPWRAADVATLTSLDLDAHAARLRSLVTTTDRTLSSGKHCKYCPAFLACPEQQALRDEADKGALAVRVESMVPFNDDDEARQAYNISQRLRLLLKRIDAALYARAAERPIPLGNGKMFGRIEKMGNEKLSGDVVYDVVKSHFGQELADAAVQRHATKKQLEAALKGKRGAVKDILNEVRALGGASRSKGYEITEYEPGPRLVTDGE